jgi:flagellar motor switch protein FliM
MTDKVLTDDEKEALLEGVATGEIEVQSTDGPRYAEVQPFEIPERCKLKSNSFPRLQRLNGRVAGRTSKLVEQLVSAEVEIAPASIDTCSYGEFCESDAAMSLAIEFSAEPLDGVALIVLGADLVGHLVEAFYGGEGNGATRPPSEFFTRGEMSVAGLFGDALLETLADVWQPLMETSHKRIKGHQNNDIIEGLDSSDPVIVAGFDICFLNREDTFKVVWPNAMLAPLLPVFEGQKRERDPAQDALWERSLRARLTDSVVSISSRVGNSEMRLGAVAELQAGDIIDIDDPQASTVFVKDVPVLGGRFGVHEGRYAVEATHWLTTLAGANS